MLRILPRPVSFAAILWMSFGTAVVSRISGGRDVGDAVVQSGGKDERHDVTFAFVFHVFHPDGRILQNEG